jgi:hypothetical protein
MAKVHWTPKQNEFFPDAMVPGRLVNVDGAPPPRNDAKCGFSCHTRAKARDYVFTDYGHR